MNKRYDHCEVYYDDGGHSGPFTNFHLAYTYALRVLKGSTSTKSVEIRPRDSKAIGGFANGNDGSFYVSYKWLAGHSAN
jgi:hypothetical protein